MRKGKKVPKRVLVLHVLHTWLPSAFFHRCQTDPLSREYSIQYSSTNSTPYPLPNLPCVATPVTTWLTWRLTWIHSRPDVSALSCCWGHHAPPDLSWLNLKLHYQRKDIKQMLTSLSVANIAIPIIAFVKPENQISALLLSLLDLICYALRFTVWLNNAFVTSYILY